MAPMENTMTPVFMPFTCLPEPTARVLASLVGPVVVYQTLENNIPESMFALASQEIIEIRTPMTGDDERLRTALVEFTQWARMNPGKSTAGAGFLGARQGEIPFFDENSINRIRSDIQRYPSPDSPANESEVQFSARLFLAVAQENDLAADSLDHDLNRFKAMEKDFLESLQQTDDAPFNREGHGGTVWREDPGARLTEQRIRSWAMLAAADAGMPELLVTTSPAVMDTLMETRGESSGLEKLATIRLAVPPVGPTPLLGRALADLAALETLQSADMTPLLSLAAGDVTGPSVTVTLFAVADRTPEAVVSRMAPAMATPHDESGKPKAVRHTLFLLVEQ